MRYGALGNSGTVVSQYALGTMTFGAEVDQGGACAILDAYIEAGGNFIDTADVYGASASEQYIGGWLAARPGMRDHVVIATKGRYGLGNDPNDAGTSRRHLDRALADSLRRLGIGQIDLYQLHGWDPITPLEETLRFLDDAIRSGKIAYYGLSNFLGWQVTKAVATARASGFTPPVTLQPQYNLLMREIEYEVVPAAIDAGLGLLAWSPLAGGWLSGKYRRDVDPTGPTRLGENPDLRPEWQGRNADHRTWEILSVVERIAAAREVNQAAVSLAWVAAQPGVTSVIVGARDADQLARNLVASSLELESSELQELGTVSDPSPADYPYGRVGARQRVRALAFSPRP